MYPRRGQITFFWRLGRLFGQTISSSNFWRVNFFALGGQKYQHDDSLCLCAFIHYISILFPPICDTRWLNDELFRGVSAKVDVFMIIWMFRGGRRQISRGADSKYQNWYWTTMSDSYCMGSVLNNYPWYTSAISMLVKGTLCRCGKLRRWIYGKIERFFYESLLSSTSTKGQG